LQGWPCIARRRHAIRECPYTGVFCAVTLYTPHSVLHHHRHTTTTYASKSSSSSTTTISSSSHHHHHHHRRHAPAYTTTNGHAAQQTDVHPVSDMAGQCKTFLLTAPRCLPLLPPLQNYMEQPASGWAHNSAALAVGKGECAIARFIHALMAMNGVDNDAKHRRVLTKNMSIARFMWPRLAWPTTGPQLAHSWPTAGPQLPCGWSTHITRLARTWPTTRPRRCAHCGCAVCTRHHSIHSCVVD
jgi:hypothetical protein